MKTKYTNLVIFAFSLLTTESLKNGCFSNLKKINLSFWQHFARKKNSRSYAAVSLTFKLSTKHMSVRLTDALNITRRGPFNNKMKLILIV